MSRYISERHAQEAMSTLICDCIRDKKKPTYDDVANALLTCPTADVVEVVRCKDCKHYWKNWKNAEPENEDDLGICLASPKDDAFCSEGERKDDGER